MLGLEGFRLRYRGSAGDASEDGRAGRLASLVLKHGGTEFEAPAFLKPHVERPIRAPKRPPTLEVDT
jgi:hypothetical protein